MITTKSKRVILPLGCILVAFITGVVWAQVNAVGEAACGIQSYHVTTNTVDVIFYHKGAVTDKRNHGAKVDVRFLTGSALYPNNGAFPYGQHNGRTDVDRATITIQDRHNWREVDDKIARGQSKGWSRTTYLRAHDNGFNPSDWWVAGVTYTLWKGQQIKAVSEYDISTPETFHRSYYRVSNTWGNGEFGRYESWPY